MPARKKRRDDSPESKIVPYESLSSRQAMMTGEDLPETILQICDACHWCASCINEKGGLTKCPICGRALSRITMAIDEVCTFEKDDTRGVTLHFERKLPVR